LLSAYLVLKHPIAASSYKLSHKVSIKTNGGGEPGFPSVRALIIPLYLSFFDTSKIEQSPDCISACDTGLRVLIWNNACRKRYGIAKEETLQKSLLYFFPHMEHDYRVSCLKEWIEGGKTFLFPNLTLLYGPDVYPSYCTPAQRAEGSERRTQYCPLW